MKAWNKEKLSLQVSRVVVGIFSFIPFITPFVIVGAPSSAGAFSFIDQLFADVQTEAKVTADAAVLQPVINTNPVARTESILQVEADTLIAKAGPIGTAVEVDEYSDRAKTLSVYMVKEGDTVSEIAELFGVSVNTILWANDLKSAKSIHVGDVLTILPVSGIRHTVVKGDTASSIAKKYKASVEDVVGYNGIQIDSPLIVGTILTIPDGVSPTLPSAPTTKSTNNAGVVAKYKSLPTYSGYFIRPISKGVRTQGLHGLNAVDLADKWGTPIYAAAAGTVIVSKSVGWNAGYGQYIVIAHANGTQTLYAHLSKNVVSVGDTVYQGQYIADMGSTGKSTGSHVHFEVHNAKNPF